MTVTEPLRTLPVAVHPKPDETFHSWATRLAHTLHVEPIRALHAAGYTTDRSRRRSDWSGYGITATPEQVDRMAFTTRATPDMITGTLLAVFNGGPINLDGYTPATPGAASRLGTREWAYFGHSNACIDCLTETGYAWNLTWRLPWRFVCTRHETVLADVCPACQQRFNAGSRRDGSLGPLVANTVPDPAVCGNNITQARNPYPSICGHPYTDIDMTAIDTAPVMETQTQLDLLLTPQHRNTHHNWWADLRATVAVILTHASPDLILNSMPLLPAACRTALTAHYTDRDSVDTARQAAMDGGDHRRAPRRRTYVQTPTSLALTAAVTPLALAFLHTVGRLPAPLTGRPSPLPDIDPVDLLHTALAGRPRRRNLTTDLRLRQASGLLLDRLAARTGYNRLQRTATRTTSRAVPTTAIPRLWPWDLYQPVAGLFHDQTVTDDYARAYLSLAAAKLVTGGTWLDAADAVGWRRRPAKGCANSITTRLNQAGHTDLIAQHVTVTLTRLPTEVDYRQLETDYRTLLTIPDHLWDHYAGLAGYTGTPTPARRRHLAAWAWHTIALMPLREWPGWQQHPNYRSARDMYRRFVGVLPEPAAGHM